MTSQTLGDTGNSRSAGWYAGAAAFWLLAAWLVTVGLSSIIPQIFWPSGGVAVAGSCEPTLVKMERELLARASESMANAATPDERQELEKWLRDWDHRLSLARPTCNQTEQPAWAELLRLRHGMHALVERFDREEAPCIRKLEALLSAGAAQGAE
jgi:DNA-binding PadR family transcriptional regulator